MLRQRIYIRKYDWLVYVFYDTDSTDADEILSLLRHIGCKGKNLSDSGESMRNGLDNTGLTFSNNRLRESVMVIGRASSLSEFLDTWQHELTHLQRHICKTYGIDPTQRSPLTSRGTSRRGCIPCYRILYASAECECV